MRDFSIGRSVAVAAGLTVAFVLLAIDPVLAHNVTEGDKAYIQGHPGIHAAPYIYLGAKHMVTGYDHLLFLFGVIFFLHRLKDVGAYVTLFAIGHSTTLLLGVLANIRADPFVVDAIIGLSVAYKAFDNLGGFRTLLGFEPNQKAAVLAFGLFHGFGLATKIQDLAVPRHGLLANLVSFNVGVEMGQFLALSLILLVLTLWRRSPGFDRSVVLANTLLLTAGFVLVGYQLTGFAMETPA